MNSGDTVDMLHREAVTVSSMTAVGLAKGDDGMYRHHVHPLVALGQVEALEAAS